MSTEDRRAPGATRIAFEALVEVGGALGPSFEAQAIDISEDGMHLRTAYLPEVGQPLTLRLDTGGEPMVVSGEVLWTQEAGKGGEFGIRFAELDASGLAALKSMLGVAQNAPAPAPRPQGTRVRMHIEGLATPMRARLRDGGAGAQVTAFSELGFLQVGKALELEDAETGAKRPAKVDRVEVEIDAESGVPRLVMRMRFDDEEARASEAALASGAPAKESTPEPTVIHDEMEGDEPNDTDGSATAAEAPRDEEDEAVERVSQSMRGPVARSAAKITPALMTMMKRAKTTIALLAAKAGEGRARAKSGDFAIPLRRKTSLPPGGGLHAEGRKVIRGDSSPLSAKSIVAEMPKKLTKKRVMIGSAIGAVALLAIMATRKPAEPVAPVAANETTAAMDAPATPPPAITPMGAAPVSPATPIATPPSTQSLTPGASSQMPTDDAFVSDERDVLSSEPRSHSRTVHAAPFSNGPVAHGNVLRIKMDGPIEKIEGAPAATGFSVQVPGRKSLEAASPLAARDGRIASIRVTNGGSGADLDVAFKDGVPNYLVRAKGDVLEIVLASPGPMADANTAPHGATPKRHKRSHHH